MRCRGYGLASVQCASSKMIASHPRAPGGSDSALIRCIEERFDCAQTGTSCADACVGEDNLEELRRRIRLNLDCAAAGSLASRQTERNEEVIRRMLMHAKWRATPAKNNARVIRPCTNIAASALTPAIVAPSDRSATSYTLADRLTDRVQL